MKSAKITRRRIAKKKPKKIQGHTPGPWRVSEGRATTVIAPDGYAICSTGEGSYVSEQWEKNNAAGKWEHLATRPENTMDRSEQEQDSNARLIAAAPELLEACRLVKRAFWHIPIPSDEGSKAYKELSDAHDKLVVAIQKATGLKQ